MKVWVCPLNLTLDCMTARLQNCKTNNEKSMPEVNCLTRHALRLFVRYV